MIEKEGLNITEAEAALYDRQIRLWGLDAQKRLRAARALLVGVSGVGAEVAKNIILCGIKSLVLLDHRQVSEEDFSSQFLASRESVGKNRAESSHARAQQLNPMVEVSADTDDVADKPDEFFTQFDVVCVTCCSTQQMKRINEICHKQGSCFYAGDVFGYYGYMFADLGEHEYAEEVLKKKRKADDGSGEPSAKKPKEEQETVTVKKTSMFCTLQKAFSVDWSHADNAKKVKKTPNTHFISQVLLHFRDLHKRDPNTALHPEDQTELLKLKTSVATELKVEASIIPDDFASFCNAELSPVCAVVGGVIGQEIIKAVSQKDAPHNNFFFYNGVDGHGMVDCIGGDK